MRERVPRQPGVPQRGKRRRARERVPLKPGVPQRGTRGEREPARQPQGRPWPPGERGPECVHWLRYGVLQLRGVQSWHQGGQLKCEALPLRVGQARPHAGQLHRGVPLLGWEPERHAGLLPCVRGLGHVQRDPLRRPRVSWLQLWGRVRPLERTVQERARARRMGPGRVLQGAPVARGQPACT